MSNPIARYVLALVLFMAGAGGATVIIISQIGGLLDGLIAFSVPGATEIDLPETGAWQVIHMPPGDDAAQDSVSIEGLDLRVQDVASGHEVPVESASGTYLKLGNRRGAMLFEFEVDSPGTYRLIGAYNRDGAPAAALHLGHGTSSRLLLSALAGIAVALVGIGGGIILAVTTTVASPPPARSRW